MALGIIGVLAYKFLKKEFCKNWIFWFGLLPSVLLGYYCTFSLSFQIQWIFLFCLILIFQYIRSFNCRIIFSLFCVPVGFFLLTTPMLVVLLAVHAALTFKSYGTKKCAYWVLPMILLGITSNIYSQQIAFIPFEQRYTEWGGYIDPLTSKNNYNGELVKKCVCLSNNQRWEDLLYREQIKTVAQRGNTFALRYALLAECALGMLPENLLDYPINEESLFLFPHQSSIVASQFNRLFYLNLGVYDDAFHHAQEYSLLMVNGNCFSSIRQLIDYSIEEGEWEIAEKFLTVLSNSSCHKDFINERRTKMKNSKKHFNKNIPLRGDNFVGGYSFPVEMLRLARYFKDSPNKKKMVDYALCAYILRGDINSFRIAINAFDFYKEKELPRAYSTFINNFK